MGNLKRGVFAPDEKYVRKLGRTRDMGEYLWLGLSGSGVEFTFTGDECEIKICGDSTTEERVDGIEPLSDQTRLGIVVDGRMLVDTMVKKPVEIYKVPGLQGLPGEAPTLHKIRIIKLSACAMSTVGLVTITVNSEDGIHPTAAPEKRIEFIGDSITCGYGVDAPSELYPFSTAQENVSEAYGYLVSEMVGADYSMVSYSGHGIVSGYVHEELGVTDNFAELVPPFYEKLGWSYNRMKGLNPYDFEWDFTWQPDVVVINLGTNDMSYTKGIKERVEAYETKYIDFLKMVRRCNPSAHILCVLGLMGDDLYPSVEKVVKAYSEETKDNRVSSFHINVQNPEARGYGADFHPSVASQKQAALELLDEIKKYL